MSDDDQGPEWSPSITFEEPTEAQIRKARRARLAQERKKRSALDVKLATKSKRLHALERQLERESARLANLANQKGSPRCEHADDDAIPVADGMAHWCRQCGAIQMKPLAKWTPAKIRS